MRYAVVKHHELQPLVAHVNAALREGWLAIGGVAYGPDGYAQAMLNQKGAALPLPDGVRQYYPHAVSDG